MSTNMYTLSLSNSMIISMKISVRKSLKCSQPNFHWGYTLETMHSCAMMFCVPNSASLRAIWPIRRPKAKTMKLGYEQEFALAVGKRACHRLGNYLQHRTLWRLLMWWALGRVRPWCGQHNHCISLKGLLLTLSVECMTKKYEPAAIYSSL